jgi:hypothetical protein
LRNFDRHLDWCVPQEKKGQVVFLLVWYCIIWYGIQDVGWISLHGNWEARPFCVKYICSFSTYQPLGKKRSVHVAIKDRVENGWERGNNKKAHHQTKKAEMLYP